MNYKVNHHTGWQSGDYAEVATRKICNGFILSLKKHSGGAPIERYFPNLDEAFAWMREGFDGAGFWYSTEGAGER